LHYTAIAAVMMLCSFIAAAEEEETENTFIKESWF